MHAGALCEEGTVEVAKWPKLVRKWEAAGAAAAPAGSGGEEGEKSAEGKDEAEMEQGAAGPKRSREKKPKKLCGVPNSGSLKNGSSGTDNVGTGSGSGTSKQHQQHQHHESQQYEWF